MDGILSSKQFKNFYTKLATPKQIGIKEYFEVIQDAMAEYAKNLHIGRANLIVNSPANGLVLEEMQDRSVIFDGGAFNSECGIRKTFVTADWGIVQIEVYSVADYSWTKDEEEESLFLIQVLYDSISRVRFSLLLNQAKFIDSSTGTCNLSGITGYAQKLYNESKLANYNVVYFRIKNYNYLSQRAGHDKGEKVLRNYTKNIMEYLVKGELLARMGGDRFSVLVEDERIKDFIKFLTSRRVIIERDDRNYEFDVMVKCGVYNIKSVDTVAHSFDCAKIAYEYTKNPSAGDVVYFMNEMFEHSEHDDTVCAEFNKALKKNEFVVYYQPKVDLVSNSMVSAEALCRWIKDGNVVPPMDFIPALEKEGSIGQLDFYMLNEVCSHIKEWIGRGIEPVKVSVNFSRANILNAKLADKILKVIDGYSISTKYIEVEITEMSGYEDFESLSEFVNVLKKNGVETSIDDFGTGYSSLNLIKDLNVDTIKLDKSFLEKISMGEDETDKFVVKNIISMVSELNMKVVAEGVETDAQKEFLKDINCQVAQGFFFDKPLPKDKFEFRLLGERVYA
ncbi:MAG: GGDEF domain-containing phosphodiesterase [Lachnospiraceae bacterium]|nr:GGDEF domain-containing phosphodiesterase [Lachnospiraceae bacterium]